MAERSNLYTPEIVTTILSQLSAGQSLRAICKAEDMPDESTVRAWVLDRPEFAPQYTRARAMGIDSLVEKMGEVASDTGRDPNCRRVEVDAIKWQASKMRPSVYGDKIEQQITGPEGGPLVLKLVPSPGPKVTVHVSDGGVVHTNGHVKD